MSFCEKADYYPNWVRYGSKGFGYSIGVSAEFFIGTATLFENSPKFGRTKIYYNFEPASKVIELMRIVQKFLEGSFNNFSSSAKKESSTRNIFAPKYYLYCSL